MFNLCPGPKLGVGGVTGTITIRQHRHVLGQCFRDGDRDADPRKRPQGGALAVQIGAQPHSETLRDKSVACMGELRIAILRNKSVVFLARHQKHLDVQARPRRPEAQECWCTRQLFAVPPMPCTVPYCETCYHRAVLAESSHHGDPDD